ncbi:hypothetical protein BDU57DRAFT_525586 [Ampelomyces quisqualis]|uniref:Uncharacterized protein n=1 Tax=Ampelomyces quisqualis TaxID=50730 RepID=A0A6A5R385_AMPQU|nr:hypothetical protein BDU57DRAFT_525586 [Ampelomyces quisqualis]
MLGLPKPTNNDGVAFRCRLLDAAQGAAQVQATRVYYFDAAGKQQHTGSGGFCRRSAEWVSLPSFNATAIDKLEFDDTYSPADLVDMGWLQQFEPRRLVGAFLFVMQVPARKLRTCCRSPRVKTSRIKVSQRFPSSTANSSGSNESSATTNDLETQRQPETGVVEKGAVRMG